jgi:hypothetical protein
MGVNVGMPPNAVRLGFENRESSLFDNLQTIAKEEPVLIVQRRINTLHAEGAYLRKLP